MFGFVLGGIVLGALLTLLVQKSTTMFEVWRTVVTTALVAVTALLVMMTVLNLYSSD